MRSAIALALALGALAAPACSHAPRAPGAKPDDCALEFFWETPKRPYAVLGEVSDFVTGRVPGTPPEALRAPACALGADAVIVTQDATDQFGHAHLAGRAIRWEEGEGEGATSL